MTTFHPFSETRPDFGPHQIRDAQELHVGRHYLLVRRHAQGGMDVELVQVMQGPHAHPQDGEAMWVTLTYQRPPGEPSLPNVEESLRDLGVMPYPNQHWSASCALLSTRYTRDTTLHNATDLLTPEDRQALDCLTGA